MSGINLTTPYIRLTVVVSYYPTVRTINGYISTGSTHPLESQQLPFFRAQHQPPAHVLSPRESRGPERAFPSVRRGHRNTHGSFAVTPLHQLLQHATSQRVSSRQKQKRQTFYSMGAPCYIHIISEVMEITWLQYKSSVVHPKTLILTKYVQVCTLNRDKICTGTYDEKCCETRFIGRFWVKTCVPPLS